MTTTPEKVRAVARHLKPVSDADLQLVIDDAYQDVLDLYKAKNEAYHERLTRYLAAHLASLNVRRATSQKVADMQVTYASQNRSVVSRERDLEATEYGQEFLRLLRLCQGTSLPLTVI